MRKSKIIENQKQYIKELLKEISRLEFRVDMWKNHYYMLEDRLKYKEDIIQKLVDEYCNEEE